MVQRNPVKSIAKVIPTFKRLGGLIYYDLREKDNNIKDKSRNQLNGVASNTIPTKMGRNMNSGKITLPINSKTNFYRFEQKSISPDIGCHQGITTDGTYYYAFHTDRIKKYDLNWNLVSENTNAATQVGVGHIGDGFVYGGVIYSACENWSGCEAGQFTNMRIGKWNASDLSYIGFVDVSAQGKEVSSCCTDGTYVYVSSYCDGTKIWKYNLSNLAYVGSVNLPTPKSLIQGISYKNNRYYISESNGNIYSIGGDWLSEEIICKVPSIGEGLDYTGDDLLVLSDNGSSMKVYSFTASNVSFLFWFKSALLPSQVASYIRLFSTTGDTIAFYYYAPNASIVFKLTHENGAPLLTERASCPESNLSTNKWICLVGTYDGSTSKIYVNGIQKGSIGIKSHGPLAKTFSDNPLIIGSFGTGTGDLIGEIGEFMLFNKALTDVDVLKLFNLTRKEYKI